MSLTREQAGAVSAPGSVAVTAGAGTGKTHMLTERYLHHLTEDRLRPLEIVAATFTERAAAELRGRIRSRLRGTPRFAGLAAELEAAQIGTLHSLAGRICREHPDAAGVPYDFGVQDEIGQRLWQERHFRAALASLPPELAKEIPYRSLVAALRALLADPFTAGRALAADPEGWPQLLRAERQRVFERLSGESRWRQAVAVLQAHSGQAGDKMELQRLAALAAVQAFEAGEFDAESCRTLDSLSRRPGSNKAWDQADLAALKWACHTLKEAYREVKYAFELSLGPADETLLRALPDLTEAYARVREQLAAAKRKERVLDFNDLELHALRALGDPEVRSFYRRRWKAFLVDEFQDTNPVQSELLGLLTGDDDAGGGTRLTVVGDEKQSIYGFRRADLTVFRQLRSSIAANGGDNVELSTSFRTHHGLMTPINDVVAPSLGELHQSLAGARTAEPGEGPFLTVHLIAGAPSLKQFRQRAEAHLVGDLIEGLLKRNTPVHDKESGGLRPARPGDIAILARNWNTLGPYGDELAARGIPTIHAGGGNLLEQRAVKDGISLLRFLADSNDALSLAAVLRSPFFAVEDRELLGLARDARREKTTWWQALQGLGDGGESGGRHGSLVFARRALANLVNRKADESPSNLLTLADDLTGYSAVISNLPGGPRRLADWRGFVEFIRQLERGHASVFEVMRELRALAASDDAKVPRPGMEAGDAVSLMSVHNAKGLEWPVVIVPDLTASPSSRGAEVVFEADAGVAFRVRDQDGEEVPPALYTILNERRKQRDADEEMRVLYVALTRARDRLILSGSKESGGRLDYLAEGLATAGVEANLVAFDPEAAVPKTPQPEPSLAPTGRLLGDPGPGLSDLPVSSLSSYLVCPKRFRFEHLLQHPGAGEGTRVAARVGSLTHLALEREIREANALQRFDPGLDREHVDRALELAEVFRNSEHFSQLRSGIVEREARVALERDGVLLQGVADAVGEDFVLDYKTGTSGEEEAHLLQVALYAQALGRSRAHVAYLAKPELRTFDEEELLRARENAERVIAGIQAGEFTATPTPQKCGACSFESICRDSALRPANTPVARAGITG